MEKQLLTKKNVYNNNNLNNMEKLTIEDLIDDLELKNEFIYVYLQGENKEGKLIKHPIGINKNYQDLEILELCEKKNIPDNVEFYIARRIHLDNQPCLVIDIDQDIPLEDIYTLYPFLQNTYYTEGNSIGFHFYISNFDLKDKIVRKQDCINSLKGDFINDNIWEKIDKPLYNKEINELTEENLKTIFKDYPIDFVKNKNKKKELKLKQELQYAYAEYKGDYNELEEIVLNIPRKHIDNYEDWIKIISILKKYNFKDLAEEISMKSKKFKKEQFDFDYEKKATFIDYNISTLFWYSKQNREKYDRIKKKYNKVNITIQNGISFEEVNKEFNKTHFKIINKSLYCRYENNEIIFFKPVSFKDAYEHKYYETKTTEGNIELSPFIKKWMTCNPTIRFYDDINIYPNEKDCPSNHFNIWTKFDIELVNEYKEDTESLHRILHHIKILCNYCEDTYEYVLDWLAHMFLYPEEKIGILLLLVSQEGAGKGLLFQLIKFMLGQSKVFETSNIARDIIGDHNAPMANAYLVILDEADYKQTKGGDGIFKNIITEPTIIINPKGKDQITVNSYHRYIGSTNNIDCPMKTVKGDRRKLIIRCSDELCGNKKYGKELYTIISSKRTQKTFYNYLIKRPNIDLFKSRDIPQNTYQQDIQFQFEEPVKDFIKYFVYNTDKEYNIIGSAYLFKDFKDYLQQENIKFEYTHKGFSGKILNLNLKGITKERKTHGVDFIFDFDMLKNEFNDHDSKLNNKNYCMSDTDSDTE